MSKYMTQKQFERRILELKEMIIRLKKYEAKGYRYKRVYVEPHRVKSYRTHGHFMRVLVKKAA